MERHRFDMYRMLFCSTECKGGYQLSGEDHPQFGLSGEETSAWKDDVTDYRTAVYGHGWPRARRNALKRDGYQCQSCGVTQEEYEHDMALDVHHIVPVIQFEDTVEANNMSNLKTLCRKCHKNEENR